jgi:hypothetical protein
VAGYRGARSPFGGVGGVWIASSVVGALANCGWVGVRELSVAPGSDRAKGTKPSYMEGNVPLAAQNLSATPTSAKSLTPYPAPFKPPEPRAGPAEPAQPGGIRRYGSANERIFWNAGAATTPP